MYTIPSHCSQYEKQSVAANGEDLLISPSTTAIKRKRKKRAVAKFDDRYLYQDIPRFTQLLATHGKAGAFNLLLSILVTLAGKDRNSFYRYKITCEGRGWFKASYKKFATHTFSWLNRSDRTIERLFTFLCKIGFIEKKTPGMDLRRSARDSEKQFALNYEVMARYGITREMITAALGHDTRVVKANPRYIAKRTDNQKSAVNKIGTPLEYNKSCNSVTSLFGPSPRVFYRFVQTKTRPKDPPVLELKTKNIKKVVLPGRPRYSKDERMLSGPKCYSQDVSSLLNSFVKKSTALDEGRVDTVLSSRERMRYCSLRGKEHGIN